jgi:hypothetical protein
LIDMIEKGNVTGAVAATNHHLSAIEERLIEAPPEKLAIDCRSLFAAAEQERPTPSQTTAGADLTAVNGGLWNRWRCCSACWPA